METPPIKCTPTFCLGGGGLILYQIFKKGEGLIGSQFREGFTRKEEGDFFQEWEEEGSCSFFMKNKLKPEIFNNKKFSKEKCFSLSN